MLLPFPILGLAARLHLRNIMSELPWIFLEIASWESMGSVTCLQPTLYNGDAMLKRLFFSELQLLFPRVKCKTLKLIMIEIASAYNNNCLMESEHYGSWLKMQTSAYVHYASRRRRA